MPNHARREKELLTAAQRALSEATRRPGIAQIDDAALMKLIAGLRRAGETASRAASEDGLSQASLIETALKRAHAERRRRKLSMASVPAEKPADKRAPAAAKTARRASAGSRRTPADRKTAEARKTDLRTGPHRVRKTKPEAAASEPDLTLAPAATGDDTALKPAISSPKPADPDEKARRKAVRKAAKKAQKDAEKEARKAARKAEKEAVRAARKVAKLAAREAEKALRKAERKAGTKPQEAGKKGKSPKPAKSQGKRKPDSAD
ncbi:hypothetical protein [Paracoccus salsus]|uniref:hypothetical protein n=1 Tax=Paracoccus salsus TaxID=2911061 RepID=UPI001F2ADE01|nr:hypothetical protein [Paracoccus salsus]MCF3973767.1 hypothetical protein [Paracoccus salsus]